MSTSPNIEIDSQVLVFFTHFFFLTLILKALTATAKITSSGSMNMQIWTTRLRKMLHAASVLIKLRTNFS